MKRFICIFVVSTGLVSGVGASFVACASSDDSGTTGKRVTLRTTATGEGAGPFTNALGWTVTLKSARMSVASLYYFDGEPIFSLRRLMPRSAFAHPGHYVAGEARGQMLSPATLDLLAPTNTLPDGVGVSGTVRSARLTFGSGVGGFAVVLEGEAKNATATVPFVARAALESLLDSFGEPKVEGCAFTATEVQADGTVNLSVRPSAWLDQVDFTDVKSDLASSPVAFNGFTRGLQKGAAYVFSYRSP